MGFIVPIIGLALSAFSSFAGGGGGGGSPPIIPAPAPPTEDAEAVKRAEKEERLRRTKARGLSTTNLTGGLSEEELQLSKNTLLGGGSSNE